MIELQDNLLVIRGFTSIRLCKETPVHSRAEPASLARAHRDAIGKVPRLKTRSVKHEIQCPPR
jgi:hypothetical protein